MWKCVHHYTCLLAGIFCKILPDTSQSALLCDAYANNNQKRVAMGSNDECVGDQ